MTTLEKIRVELHATAEMHDDGDYYLRDKWVDEIIDKYAEQEPTEDYEYEIECLQKRLDIAEYDKERLKEKIKALEQEPCDDVVSRQAVLDGIEELKQSPWFNDDTLQEAKIIRKEAVETVEDLCVKQLPSVRPQEQTGHWIRITNGAMKEKYICSECGRQIEDDGIEVLLPIKYPYCHCGARMESEDKG